MMRASVEYRDPAELEETLAFVNQRDTPTDADFGEAERVRREIEDESPLTYVLAGLIVIVTVIAMVL